MLLSTFDKNLITHILEAKLKEGNLEYVKGMLAILSHTQTLQEDFAIWTDYVHWAELASIQRSKESLHVS